MPLVRRFLDWNRPLLVAAVEELAARYGRGPTFDLSNVIVVTPGANAGRRLLELLVERAENISRPLVPPRFVTQGELPELLYEAKKPFANSLDQQLAWVRALRDFDRERLRALLPHPPAEGDLDSWREVADVLVKLHQELAADNLSVHDVLTRAAKLPHFNETDRWSVLDALRDQYLRTLDQLELWDKQTARLFAIEHRECRCEREILLIGLVDMNRVLRGMLDQLADRVTALVFAPQSLADRFDEYGCLVVSKWLDARVPLDDAQMVVADAPGDQADDAMRWLASLGGRFSAAEITIGVVDEQLVPHLQQRLEECGLRGRFGGGKELSQTGPYQLLSTLADYVGARRSDALAALVRHPGIEAWLHATGVTVNTLAEVDKLLADRLPAEITDRLVRSLPKESAQRRIVTAIESLATPLRGSTRAPGDWGKDILGVLLAIYGRREWNVQDDAQRQTVEACEQIVAAVRELQEMRAELAPSISGSEALRWLLDSLSGRTIPPRADPEAVELLGWLELPLDDAPALALVGFNEGLVPASRNGDLFLPDTLRRQLNLEDNERRYARDAYALTVLAASRRELRIIAGRRTGAGDPLLPSRLLFATDDDQLARRTLRCFHERQGARRPIYPATISAAPKASFAPQPPPPLAEPVTSMKVTEFRDYLACPYRYYLKHRLELEAVDDALCELDELQFGNLLHEVVEKFGKSDCRDSTDPNVIGDFLIGTLDETAQRKYADRTWPAVGVQLEMARQRLWGFARWQAQWRAEGNEIARTEVDTGVEHDVFLMVDGQKMNLRGRIDRIDYNAKTRQWFIFDYKTGAQANTPQKQHQRRDGQWVDLQLPLYRYLARRWGVEGEPQLGYIALPASVDAIEFLPAPWDEAALREADEVAADVVRKVRAQIFWPPAKEPPAFGAEFAPIVGDDPYAVLAQVGAAEEESP